MDYTLNFHIESNGSSREISIDDLLEHKLLLKEGDRIWAYPNYAKKVPASYHQQLYYVIGDQELKSPYPDPQRSAFIESLGFKLIMEEGLFSQLLAISEMSALIFSESGALIYANAKAKESLELNLELPLGLIKIEDFSWEQNRQRDFKLGSLKPHDFGLGSLHHQSTGKSLHSCHLMRKVFKWQEQKFILLEFKHLPDLKVFRQKLDLSESKSKLLLEQNFGAFVLTNEKGQITYSSGEVFKITGYNPQEVLGHDSLEFAHPEDRPDKLKALAEIESKNKASVEVKYRIRHRDGSFRWVLATIINHLESPGINAFVTIVRDNHQQQLLEFELKKSINRYRWASRATKDVLWDWDFANDRIEWGENLGSAFGYEEHELDTTQKWLSKIPKDDQEKIDTSLNKAFENKLDNWECHYRFKLKNGKLAYIHDRGYIARNSSGEAIRLIGAMHDYSLQHQRETELRAEQKKFRQLFEGSLIGVAQLDLQTNRWKECNQALLNMLGYKSSEFKGMPLEQLIPADQLKKNAKTLDQLWSNHSVKAFQSSLLRKDLGITKVVVSAFVFTEKEGSKMAWFHFFDLGPIEESNQALSEAETRFRNYIEKASDIFATINHQGVFDYISPNVEQLLGYPAQEVMGHENKDLIHPNDYDKVIKLFQEALSMPGETKRLVFRLKHKNGQWMWMEANGSFQAKGSDLRAFLNIRDIEKEHQIEAELRKLSLVANRTSNGVLIVDAQSRVEWLNQSYQQMSGYSLEEAQGQAMATLVHGPKSIHLHDHKLKSLLASKQPFRLENINYRKDGTEFWVESIVTPIFDDNHVLTNYISIETDITERKMEEIHFQENMALISEQNERLRSFGHIVSHNFRSHGSNIQQLSRELNITSDPLLREELYKYLEESASGLMEALDELSSLLKVDSASDLPTEELAVKEYCERVRQILSRPTMEINAELQFDIPEDFTVKFYPAYLESVLFNLLSNALRYHDPKKDPWVKVWVEENADFKMIYVSDNGLGIDTERYGDEIFKYRRSVHNHPESTGIGLYLIRSQIESLGGEISVSSIEGKGSTFKVSVPK